MLVDELLFVDHLGADGPLGGNFDALGLKASLDDFLDGVGDRVRLDETEGLHARKGISDVVI